MNIALFANGPFALNAFKSLLETNHKIKYVVTNIDKRVGRNQSLQQTCIAKFAQINNLNVLKIQNFNNENFINRLKDSKPDLFIVISYRILPKFIYSIPKFGSINIHASFLPEYPGASPIQRSIMNGENHLGLTSFILNDKIDNGDIIYRKKYPIDDKITYGEALNYLSLESQDILLKTLDSFLDIIPKKQINNNIKYASKIKSNEYKISLNDYSFNIHNLFRGLTPPGPYLFFNDKKVKLFDTYYKNSDNDKNYRIGSFFVKNNILHIKCESGYLLSKKIQFESKKIIYANDFNNMNIDKLSIFE